MIKRGDILLARFPFADQTISKIRPVLILAEIPGPYRDFLVMFISSQLHQALPDIDVTVPSHIPPLPAAGSKSLRCSRCVKSRPCPKP